MDKIETRLIDLKSEDPRTRYEAVLFFARYPKTPGFDTFWDAVWALTKDPDERVVHAAGIAGSMISARNSPLPWMDYVPMCSRLASRMFGARRRYFIVSVIALAARPSS